VEFICSLTYVELERANATRVSEFQIQLRFNIFVSVLAKVIPSSVAF